MPRRPSNSFVAAAVLALLPFALQAQDLPNVERGFNAERTFQVGDIDNVNLFNGNLVLTVPLGQEYPVGGGLSYRLTLVYNSNVWATTCPYGPNQCLPGYVWRDAWDGDAVCVTPDVRTQAHDDNAHAAERIDPACAAASQPQTLVNSNGTPALGGPPVSEATPVSVATEPMATAEVGTAPEPTTSVEGTTSPTEQATAPGTEPATAQVSEPATEAVTTVATEAATEQATEPATATEAP